MKTSEEAALGRVLAISREAYSAVKNGETERFFLFLHIPFRFFGTILL